MAEQATLPPDADASLTEVASRLAAQLAATGTRLVLAESCTGGLAAAALTRVPGISRWFCGSAVAYRERTKVAWLDVDPAELARDSAVSGPVTGAMACGALRRTGEAHVAAAITGHLGPDAPPGDDGRVWVAVADRRGGEVVVAALQDHQLATRARGDRQREAAAYLLAQVSRRVTRPAT